MRDYGRKVWQGGVTPIDSIVSCDRTGQPVY